MSEYKVPEVRGQTLSRLTQTYSLQEVRSHTLVQPTAHAQFNSLKAASLCSVVSGMRITGIKAMYLRSARLKDMSKPLFVTEARSQTLVRVTTDVKLTKVEAVVMQSQIDKLIPDEADGVLQSHLY